MQRLITRTLIIEETRKCCTAFSNLGLINFHFLSFDEENSIHVDTVSNTGFS